LPEFQDNEVIKLPHGCLNLVDISFVDCSFSNSNRQHDLPIAEKCRGRQQKMNINEKKSGRQIRRSNAGSLWVEMKNHGLKIVRISGLENY
jgi:hypothetical protein